MCIYAREVSCPAYKPTAKPHKHNYILLTPAKDIKITASKASCDHYTNLYHQYTEDINLLVVVLFHSIKPLNSGN